MHKAIMTNTAPHPLDPLSSDEVCKAAQALNSHLRVEAPDVRFKVIDLFEPVKQDVLAYLHDGGPRPHPDPTRELSAPTWIAAEDLYCP